MVISAISPTVDALPQTSPLLSVETAQRQQLRQPGTIVNESGSLGKNQIVFSVDRATHRPIIRIEDRVTHEVILQLPAEYLLRLATDIHSDSARVTSLSADM